MIFFTVKPKRKSTKQNNKTREKFGESCRSNSASKTAAKSLWLPVGLVARLKVPTIAFLQFNKKSRIPVRMLNHLNSNSGKSSSSKVEVNMKQRILKNRLEKSQNNPPSRIPIPISRANSKDVGSDKMPKTVITATVKRPLGTNSGIVDTFIVFKAFSLRFKQQTF